jgi:hypothetical protein
VGQLAGSGLFVVLMPLPSYLLTKRDPELANVINTAQTLTRALV